MHYHLQILILQNTLKQLKKFINFYVNWNRETAICIVVVFKKTSEDVCMCLSDEQKTLRLNLTTVRSLKGFWTLFCCYFQLQVCSERLN